MNRLHAIPCLLLSMVVLSVGQPAHAQEADEDPLWVRHYLSELIPSNDFGSFIDTDAAGYVFVTGTTELPPLGRTFHTIKYDHQGEAVWSTTYAEVRTATPEDIAIDARGDVYVAARVPFGEEGEDLMVVKYDGATGEERWTARHAPGEAVRWNDGSVEIGVDETGGVFVTGVLLDRGSLAGGLTLKYLTDGTLVWAASHVGWPAALAPDGEGGVFVTGWFRAAIATNVPFTVRYDATGAERWEVHGDTQSRSAYANDLFLDETGDLYVAGNADGFFLVKYDGATGAERWVAHAPGVADWTVALAVTASAAYVAGYDIVDRFCKDSCPDDFITAKFDTTGSLQWIARYDGADVSNEEPTDLVADETGVYVTGISASRNVILKYDAETGTEVWRLRGGRLGGYHITLDGAGDLYVAGSSDREGSRWDYRTAKYDADDATEQWVAYYDGPRTSSDQAVAFTADASGNVYLTGWARTEASNACQTVKYDAEGILQWGTYYSSPGGNNCWTQAIAVDARSYIYILARESDDYVTITYDADGALQWVARYDGPASGDEVPTDLAVDAAGNVYVTGASEGTTTYRDYATVKYDAEGREVWVARHVSAGGNDFALALIHDGAGGVYVSGQSVNDNEIRDSDILVVKYDAASGEELWTTRYGGPAHKGDDPVGLALGPSGSVYVAGSMVGLGDGFSTRAGYGVVKYSPEGEEQWETFFDGLTKSQPQAVAMGVDAAGSVYVTGQGIDSTGTMSYATVKFDAEGNTVWEAAYHGGDEQNRSEVNALAVEASGAIYVVGRSGPGRIARDPLIVKYSPEGAEQRVFRFQGSRSASLRPVGMAFDEEGNVYVGGTMGETFTVLKYKGTPVPVDTQTEAHIPFTFRLNQNYPNPFNPITKITFVLDEPGFVTLRVFDVLGREVRTLLSEYRPRGEGQVIFQADDLPSGTYFYRLTMDSSFRTGRMTLIK